jgi:hypothetical protein
MQHESSKLGFPDSDRGGTLEGIVVIELTETLAGEFAGGLLADLGATVIKVEPPEGSPLRRLGPGITGEDALYFQSENRGKYSVCAEVKVRTHEAWLERLLSVADAVVEDLGLGRLEAAACRQRLVWLRTRLHFLILETPQNARTAAAGSRPGGEYNMPQDMAARQRSTL